jgi:hypothetical protein
MKASFAVGLVLIVLGIVALAYQGFSYTTHKQVFKAGPIEATKTEHKTIPLPPVLGGLALVGGVIVMAAGRKSE